MQEPEQHQNAEKIEEDDSSEPELNDGGSQETSD